MRNERYELEISGESMIFEFVSEGPKGTKNLIKKRVEYRQIGNEKIYKNERKNSI